MTACPRRILSGTMSGFVIRSLYTRAWKTWIDPSSDELAKSGYVGWKCTERSAREWYLGWGKTKTRVSISHTAHGTRLSELASGPEPRAHGPRGTLRVAAEEGEERKVTE